MSGLHPVDGVVLVAYLAGVICLGVWLSRRVHNLGDFLMPRRFGKAMMVTHAFGTGTASDQAVIVASATFTRGISGIWYQWLWLFATPFYWLIAPIMRRFRALTTADVYELRYDHSVGVLFAVVGIVNMAVKLAVMLKGSGALVESSTGGLVSANTAIALTTLMFVTYGVAGGLRAAIVIDFFQGLLTLGFSFMLLPFVWKEVNGMSGIRQAVPDEGMLSLVAPGEIGWFFIVMMGVQALVGIVAQPFIMGVCGAGRTEMDGRVGFTVGNFVKRLCTIAWCLTAIAAVAWYVRSNVSLSSVTADNVYGDVARAFLPGAMPGLLGVFLAGMLAGVMSSCGAFMISASGLFTNTIYKSFVQGASERHYVTVGRVMAAVVVLGGLTVAYLLPNVVEGLKIWLAIAPMMGIAFWLGLFWRRATAAGAWAGVATASAVWLLTRWPAAVAWIASLPMADSLSLVWRESGKPPTVYEPWRIVAYMVAGISAAVVVSLLSRPVARDRLDRFYGLIHTPIAHDEKITEPCTLPAGVQPASRRVLAVWPHIVVPVPSRTSVIGFLAAWVGVAVLVIGFKWLVRF